MQEIVLLMMSQKKRRKKRPQVSIFRAFSDSSGGYYKVPSKYVDPMQSVGY